MIKHEEFEQLYKHIFVKTGINIVESNTNAVKRFVHKKIDNIMSISQYLNLISTDEDEFHQLIKVVTINETYFFREEKYFKLIDEIVLPEFNDKKHTPPFIWSAAVSTGEEAVSLALLINKHWNINILPEKVIMASDIDVHSMNQLQVNRFKKGSIRNDGNHFHDLIFENSKDEGGCIIINKNIIDIIDTCKINLIRDDFESNFQKKPDIICLCNVLIYMEKDVRDNIIDKAATLLNNDGYLFVSSSNTAFIDHPLLELKRDKNCFYFKKISGGANA